MTDTVIKGSGNSRTLKTVPNAAALYPTYDAFIQAFAAGELPIDLGPLNEAGLNVRGTDLNKETLLKDATAALYGKTSEATVNEILAAIAPWKSDIQARFRVVTGTYAGTISEEGSMYISTPFAPHVVVAIKENYVWYRYGASYPRDNYYGAIAVRGVASRALEISGNGFYAKSTTSGVNLASTYSDYIYFALG